MADVALEMPDERSIHLVRRDEWTLAEPDDALVTKVKVSRIPVGHDPPFPAVSL
ncbi:hypothetical protein [Pseudooceanicola algae]|uniref:Uncharacterized protein n=1 Tax=Pseudooceanicola algae TaxID=1537215 RepID=A0A418SLA3_9RHOB|nr:hypothetical protein [Pseudooceanicola algae]QPM90606.1 hypothetical protein PSAL_018450 [Pseudooceanicola algae]